MGMLADFYAGETDAVLAALQARQTESIPPPGGVFAHADFCLNLHGVDLDTLSELLFLQLGRDAVGVFASIAQDLNAAPKQGYGVHIMSPDWVAAVASYPDERVDKLMSAWCKAVAEEAGEAVRPPSPEAIRAVNDLLVVCRTAMSMQVAVVFFWNV
jgi:hypothetical protein